MYEPPWIKPSIVSNEGNLRDIRFGLNRFSNVIVFGSQGAGKTLLLNLYKTRFEKEYGIVNFIPAYQFELNNDIEMVKEMRKHKYSLLLIDSFDRIKSPFAKERVLKLFKESRKYGMKIIMSVKDDNKISVFEKYAYPHRIERFSDQAAQALFSELLLNEKLSSENLILFKDLLKHFKNDPEVMYQIVTLLKANVTPKKIIDGLNSEINYTNKILEDYKEGNRIIIPEQKKLITDVRVVNKALYDLIKKRPSDMYDLTAREFEIFVAELFEREGYEVELTPQTRDGGKDIIVAENSILGKLLFYVECKKFSIGNPVSVNVIQRLHGAVVADKATAGIVVTSSYFSKPAISHTNKIRNQMSLIDYVELNNRIKKLNK